MKNKFALIITFLATTFAFAQGSKDVGTFNKLSVYDQIQVTLIHSTDSNKIELKGEGSDKVNVINKNGQLKIKMNFANSFQGEDVKATLYYNKLDEINVGEGATVSTKENINATKLDINAKTGSTIKLAVDVDRLNIKAGAGSVVRISGNANVQDIVSNSGAEVKNSQLITNQTSVTVNAGGNASVNATKLVEAKTRAGGNISIYGNPEEVIEKTVAGGSIKKVN